MIIRGQEIFLQPWNLDAQKLIVSRLTGEPETGLPGLSGDEQPVDILVDLADLDQEWRGPLQGAVAGVLRQRVPGFEPDDEAETRLLGELCYLAARIGSTAALVPIGMLAGNVQATGLVAPGEHLRMRALRSYVGLLGATPNSQGVADRAMLMTALLEPPLAVVALTGLIGVWPGERENFLKQLPANAPHGELLEVGIALAFPSQNPRSRTNAKS
jgi:hypothetical protein